MGSLLRALLRVLRLEQILVLVNAGLIAVAVILVASLAISRVERLAHEQARGRVELAGASALRALSRSGDDVLVTARLLAERPTLRRLLEAEYRAALATFLDRFRTTSGLSGAAVVRDARAWISAGATLDYAGFVAGQGSYPGRFVAAAEPGLMLGASAAVPELSGFVVVVARALDAEAMRGSSSAGGLPVAVVSRIDVERAADSPRRALRQRALEWEEPVTELVEEEDAYVSVLPLRSPSGEVAGIVETALGRAEVLPSVRRFRSSMLAVSLGVAALGAIASVLLARRLVVPVRRLRAASERIGRGDLSTPIPRAAGREVGELAATMEDMRTKLLRLTVELRRRRADADAILGGIAEGVFAVDAERRIRYLNPQAAALLGVGADSALGRFCGDVLRPHEEGGGRPCEERCPIVHARFRGSSIATEHLETAGGVRRTVVITSAGPAVGVIHADEGSAESQQIQVIRDESGAETSRRLRDAVLANISHEFRTPLAAQLASIELLRDRLPELEIGEIQKLVLSIERGTVRLTQLIDNLLESVRIEAGQDSIRRQVVALDEVVEEAADIAAPLLALREQELEVDLPYPLPPVGGDRARLLQVFVNLIGNANKFSPPGSKIRIGGERAKGSVTLWVEDQGPGVPEHESEAIFERFTRSTTEEPEESGMGLGLWIVRSIVERHGGTVAVRAADQGGARLSLTLPAESNPA